MNASIGKSKIFWKFSIHYAIKTHSVWKTRRSKITNQFFFKLIVAILRLVCSIIYKLRNLTVNQVKQSLREKTYFIFEIFSLEMWLNWKFSYQRKFFIKLCCKSVCGKLKNRLCLISVIIGLNSVQIGLKSERAPNSKLTSFWHSRIKCAD